MVTSVAGEFVRLNGIDGTAAHQQGIAIWSIKIMEAGPSEHILHIQCLCNRASLISETRAGHTGIDFLQTQDIGIQLSAGLNQQIGVAAVRILGCAMPNIEGRYP